MQMKDDESIARDRADLFDMRVRAELLIADVATDDVADRCKVISRG